MLYQSETRDICIALAGDTMLTRRLAVFKEERFLSLAEILRSADVGFANLEGPVRAWDEGAPGITQGTYMTTRPALLEDLKWLGINLVSCANNHAFDYGEGGLLATIGHLNAADLPQAGAGRNLAEARAPAYLDTMGGRVALVAATATFRAWNRAGEQRPDMAGRPGISPIAHETTYTVDAAAYRELRRVSVELGFEKSKARDRRHFFSEHDILKDEEDATTLFGNRFRLGDAFSVSTTPDDADLEAILTSIREARRQADWVVVSYHSHEFGGLSALTATSRADLEEPAEFATEVAHRAIDAGADIFVGHGSHMPLGIEFYKGRPVLYSVGNFIFQNETVHAFPDDAYRRFDLGPEATPADFLDARTDGDRKGHPASPGYWRNVIASCQFRDGSLDEIRLFPIDQGHGRPRAQRGRPMLADAELGAEILDRLQRLSRRYGTKIAIEDGVGVARI